MKLSYKPFHVCQIIGCYSLTRTHELCKFHKHKLDKWGDPLYVKPKKNAKQVK